MTSNKKIDIGKLTERESKIFDRGYNRGIPLGGVLGILAGLALTIVTGSFGVLSNARENARAEGYAHAKAEKLHPVDLNDDGRDDIISVREDGQFDVFMNQGDGNYLTLDKHTKSRRLNEERVYDTKRGEVRTGILADKVNIRDSAAGYVAGLRSGR